MIQGKGKIKNIGVYDILKFKYNPPFSKFIKEGCLASLRMPSKVFCSFWGTFCHNISAIKFALGISYPLGSHCFRWGSGRNIELPHITHKSSCIDIESIANLSISPKVVNIMVVNPNTDGFTYPNFKGVVKIDLPKFLTTLLGTTYNVAMAFIKGIATNKTYLIHNYIIAYPEFKYNGIPIT